VKWRAPDGRTIETITLSQTSDPDDAGHWLYVTYPGGRYAERVRSPAGLAGLGIDLAELQEVTDSRVNSTPR
jgi:hypothetical protein